MQQFVVIMAGGVGSRFWPKSREASPKQLLKIVGDNTMIQDTVARLDGLIESDHIFVITNKIQKAIVEEQLPQLKPDQIIAEPVGRNTAPCVGLAALLVQDIDPNAVILTLPADHLIRDVSTFQKTMQRGLQFAYESKNLVTFGITPTRPDTGYGYIHFDSNAIRENVFPALSFEEKPHLEKAYEYVESGDYLWNSGMFAWRADIILQELQKYQPDLYTGLTRIEQQLQTDSLQSTLGDLYPSLTGISIDYAVMEESERVFVIKSDFDWNDVGSWETVYELYEKDADGNAIIGDAFVTETHNSYIDSPHKFIAVIGEDNLIVIDTKDATLICNRKNVQQVREVVKYLQDRDQTKLT